MEWMKILKAATEIAAISNAVVGFSGEVRKWFNEIIARSEDREAKKTWEDFQREPEQNKEKLAQVVQRLKPQEDPLLRGYVLGIAKQKTDAKQEAIYELLSGDRFMYDQVLKIYKRVVGDLLLGELGLQATKDQAASKIVAYIRGKDEAAWQKLIGMMLEINPDVIVEIVKLS